MNLKGCCREISRPGDLWLFCRLTGLMALMPVLLRAWSLPTLLRVLGGRRGGQREPDRRQWQRIIRLGRRATGLYARLGRHICLMRSLVLFHFLQRAGLDVHIHFGLINNDPKLGHCWVSLEGEPFLENLDHAQDYLLLYSVG